MVGKGSQGWLQDHTSTTYSFWVPTRVRTCSPLQKTLAYDPPLRRCAEFSGGEKRWWSEEYGGGERESAIARESEEIVVGCDRLKEAGDGCGCEGA
ncbi:hypothetical protein Vadar_029626 [Vaccinium darrowii]|uniref:Uncharacterized protein n=1 Tax=Vaccinium darrowii TaxID=229202 RepID=A0ACB7YR40_9ERIC|nr:hypothetical protein Vadar_029626 [Vaccinium darrowii]